MEVNPAYLDAVVLALSNPRHPPPIHNEHLELFVQQYLSKRAQEEKKLFAFREEIYATVLEYLSATDKIQVRPAYCYRLSHRGLKQFKERIQRLRERG